MSEEHLDAHLERVLTGDAGLDDPEVAELLASRPEARERLRALEELSRRLDDAGGEARATLDASSSVAAAPGSERVGPVLRGLVRESAPARIPIRFVAAAAALVFFAGLLWMLGPGSGEPREEPGDVYLGDGAIELLEPSGEIGGWGRFRWSSDLPAGGWFTLEVRGADDPPGTAPIVRETDLTENEWTPSRDLPDRIRLRIVAHDAGGVPSGSFERELSLSR